MTAPARTTQAARGALRSPTEARTSAGSTTGCGDCRIGFVAKLSVDEEHQDRGIATCALAKTRSRYPGFQWCTSGQYVTVRTFWARTARKSGEHYLPPDDQLRPCSHIDR